MSDLLNCRIVCYLLTIIIIIIISTVNIINGVIIGERIPIVVIFKLNFAHMFFNVRTQFSEYVNS